MSPDQEVAGYLLDTNICVYFLNAQRKGPSRRTKLEAAIWERFLSERSPLLTSDVTLGELHFGAERSERPLENLRRLDAFLQLVPPLPVPTRAWPLFGNTKTLLSKKGRSVPDLDLLIACTARCHGLVLVSNDAAFAHLPEEFPRESWV